jgi:hypothetical protein
MSTYFEGKILISGCIRYWMLRRFTASGRFFWIRSNKLVVRGEIGDSSSQKENWERL